MKTIKIFIVVCSLFFFTNTNAQLKVYQTGTISLGSITAPPSGMQIQVIGNSLFSASTSSITSSAFIRGLNTWSTATTPDYTWYNNDQVGIFHPAANIIGFTTTGTERMRIGSGGNFLIGTTTDNGSKFRLIAGNQTGLELTVSQTSDYGFGLISYVNRTTTKGLAVWYNSSEKFTARGDGSVWAYSYNSYSDINLKQNIKSIESALNKVLKLNGCTYTYKPETLKNKGDSLTVINNEFNSKTHIGFIAQEVEKVVPELVNTSDNGLKGIEYQNLSALLVEAIKEQNKQIIQLQNALSYYSSNTNSINLNKEAYSKMNIDEMISSNPSSNYLSQNTPNPFDKSTVITYYVGEKQTTSSKILIFNMQGTLVKTIPITSLGKGAIEINGSELMPGMYMYTLVVNDKEVETKRMILTN